MNYSTIKITTTQAEDILLKLFNIKGTAKELPGELDFNFRIKVEGSYQYILKVSRPDENEDYLDFQQKLLQFIEDKNKTLVSPKVIKDLHGNSISEIIDEHDTKRKVRLLSWSEIEKVSRFNRFSFVKGQPCCY